jgi:Glutaminase
MRAHPRPGYIKSPVDTQPRPLTLAEAKEVFSAVAARGEHIAFRYLFEGCECRAQLMMEFMETKGIDPGRAWILTVGRDLAIKHPNQPRATIKWRNHTAPTVAVDGVEHGVLVIDPSTQTKPATIREWALSMRAKAIVVSGVPLSQAEILSRQSAQALRSDELDGIVFTLPRGQAPIPEVGGSGFRIALDPPEGVSAFAHRVMERLLELQQQMGSARP